MPSVAMVSLAIFSASAVLPSLHIFVISSTFARALLLASSARVPTSTLILATHFSQSLIGCCPIAGAASQAREARATTAVIIRVICHHLPLGTTWARLRRRSNDGAGVSGYCAGASVVLERGGGGRALLRRTERANFCGQRSGAGRALGAGLRGGEGGR